MRMNSIDILRRKIAANQFEYSEHALDQSVAREISVRELKESMAAGDVIEDYPITIYEPDPERWIGLRERRRGR